MATFVGGLPGKYLGIAGTGREAKKVRGKGWVLAEKCRRRRHDGRTTWGRGPRATQLTYHVLRAWGRQCEWGALLHLWVDIGKAVPLWQRAS